MTAAVFVLAAVLFAVLAVAQAARGDRVSRAVAVAAAASMLWAATVAVAGLASPSSALGESGRNLAWLLLLHILLSRSGSGHPTLALLYAALSFVVVATGVLDLAQLIVEPVPSATLLGSIFALRMIFAIGALVAVHNLYSATAQGARAGVWLPFAALACLWTADLTYYALGFAQGNWPREADVARGIVIVGVAGLMGLAARRNSDWTIRLSRSVTFRGIGLVAALAYLALILVISRAFASSVAQLIPITAAAIAGLAMASPRARAWCNVMIAKHLFAHRYDYRAEWLRFTDTLGVPDHDAPPLEQRVVKAVADIVTAPGGLLLVPLDDGPGEGLGDGLSDGLSDGARWRWDTLDVPPTTRSTDLIARLTTGRIVDLDTLRRETVPSDEAAAMPEWIIASETAWAIVPLVHFNRLVGAVLLERPPIARALDWEDFDLLRLAGRQVASYLAEAAAHEALGEAARFDEFNRRFAFIMHDVKNLVSQLGLVARNAERHADNPEFRVDMVATLQSATGRMNDLLARLSQHNSARAVEAQAVDLATLASNIAVRLRGQHPVVVDTRQPAIAFGDAPRLTQALGHVVQNAIEASDPNEPVTLMTVSQGHDVGIAVIDRGSGMSADFVRGSLFRAFASTKAEGFGVGAHEARAIVAAMGGRIEVKSVVGEGTRMTIWLADAASETQVAA